MNGAVARRLGRWPYMLLAVLALMGTPAGCLCAYADDDAHHPLCSDHTSQQGSDCPCQMCHRPAEEQAVPAPVVTAPPLLWIALDERLVAPPLPVLRVSAVERPLRRPVAACHVSPTRGPPAT